MSAIMALATSIPAGVLLPVSVLASDWFTVLAAFVAFNTLMYAGLTVFKLIPWPRTRRERLRDRATSPDEPGARTGEHATDG